MSTPLTSSKKPLYQRTIQVVETDGKTQTLTAQTLKTLIHKHCHDLPDVNLELVLEQILLSDLYNGMSFHDVTQALPMGCSHFMERDPAYGTLAARLLLDQLYQESGEFLDCNSASYQDYFAKYIQTGITLELLSPELGTFDLETLGRALDTSRDDQFSYHSLRTLYDRYFIHAQERRIERPQAFFMRVAMGLSLKESHPTEKAIEFYKVLARFEYMVSTPTLFNAGTLNPQLSSCFLTTVPDDLKGIYEAATDNVMLSKFAGGLGNDWSRVRATGSFIKSTNGKSQGVIPFMNVFDASAIAVNQGGKRKGAVCAYLETWHLDMEGFLELRKNTGDDRRRTHDMNTANWVPDLFMKRVHQKQPWTLFSPDEVPDLHETYGLAFESTYEAYEAKALAGKIKNYKQIPAVTLWRKMLNMLYETGHPWITFKDPCNLRSPQQHTGIVHSSNLCTEITLNTSDDEVAVCNLGSINLAEHLDENNQWDTAKLKDTVFTSIRMLDNVIDVNFYTVEKAKRANSRHRPIGLGIMGFQDVLFKRKIAFEDAQMVTLADEVMELVSYYAIEASTDLAKERGSYSSFRGSLWDQGILPIDSIALLKHSRGHYLTQDQSARLDWDRLRAKVKAQGMRNSNCLAIAPTATISNICNITPSIEPIYQNLFVKSNMSGEFTVVNTYLVNDLKALNMWDQDMIEDLKYYDGSIQKIDRIPEKLKKLYATAFEIDPSQLLEAASRRQKWLDQSQSVNLFIAQPSGPKFDKIYREAWLRGLKTTYYPRSLVSSDGEKSTTNRSTLNAVSPNQLVSKAATSLSEVACRIDDESCEACQ